MDYFVLKQYESSNALLSLKTSKVMQSCFFFFFLVHVAQQCILIISIPKHISKEV